MTVLASPTRPYAGDQLAARRAVEALRCGVPSRDAVAALGSGQGEIEDRFQALLDGAGTARPTGQRGLLLGGGFGSGKTHLLEHLSHLALERGFVVSRVVVSKETPLHDPAKMLRAAVESATLPNGAQGAVTEAALGLEADSPAYVELLRWASGAGSPVDERFALTTSLLPGVQSSDGDFAEAIIRFWSGDPIAVTDLRRQAKAAGQTRPLLATIPAKELARQRFTFLGRLFVAAGWEGWVVILDEVELIGRYSLLQRGRSYAEIAGWLRPDTADPGSSIVPVLAMTDDFDAAVLTDKGDRDSVPAKLRARGTPEGEETANRAETGIRLIEKAMVLLDQPDAEELDRVYARVKRLHGEAFGWLPPDVPGLERLGTTRMRQYVRAWINEWDLVRIDPAYRPVTETVAVGSGYPEQPELEE